ncbi:MAG: hypothetical protein JXA09_07865 [Anaerolineae bacterium]|nr:hypothetical protein [Anaerolineae bacterium]
MTERDQLEVITPDGEITFFSLDPQGITDIGQHADNDIVLAGAGVAPVQATIDHRARPARIMFLEGGLEPNVGGTPAPLNTWIDMPTWEPFQLGGYVLVWVEGGPAPGAERVPEQAEAAPSRQPETGPRRVPFVPLPAQLRDVEDEYVVVELAQRTWIVDPGQTIIAELSIANGGPLIDWFEIAVEGVPPWWVELSDDRVELNEKERDTVTLSITPPRESSSAAGVYPFGITVTSVHDARHHTRLGAQLSVTPFYAFSVGELTPKQQTIPWRKRFGTAELPLTNNGNSTASFRVDGTDDERVCHFEFEVPDEAALLAGQAQLRIPAGETYTCPVHITPPRRLIALRSRTLPYTLTANSVEGAEMPRSVIGRVRAAPLIGPWLIALILLLLAALIVLIFLPRARAFTALPSIVGEGTPVVLEWQVSRLARPHIEPGLGRVQGPESSATVVPLDSTTYELQAVNWLSRLSPRWFLSPLQATVQVTPLLPHISSFGVQPNQVFAGEKVVLTWDVLGADKLELFVNGVPDSLDQLRGGREVELGENTTFVLEASNRHRTVPANATVIVTTPTPTPTPTLTPTPVPVLQAFNVQPLEILRGESVTIRWQVANIDTVTIFPIPGAFAPTGEVLDAPEVSTQYRLQTPDGTILDDAQVIVSEPPPPPEKPVIDFFRPSEDEIVLGTVTRIELLWAVSGDYTNIEISGPDLGTIAGLPARGSIPFTPSEAKAYIFVLTAQNEDLTASGTAQLNVLAPPTPTPLPTATPTPPVITFAANAVRGEVDWRETVDTGQGPKHIYDVLVGSDVKLSWSTQNADKLTLDGEEQVEVSVGSVTVDDVVAPSLHTLIASNNGDYHQVKAFIELDIISPPPPPPPYGLSGKMLPSPSGGIELSWTFAQPAGTQPISGFLVYSAVVPSDDFQVLEEDTSFNLEQDLTRPRRFTQVDPHGTCGLAYYVVAYYRAIEDNKWVIKETDASANSWYSPQCPAHQGSGASQAHAAGPVDRAPGLAGVLGIGPRWRDAIQWMQRAWRWLSLPDCVTWLQQGRSTASAESGSQVPTQ